MQLSSPFLFAGRSQWGRLQMLRCAGAAIGRVQRKKRGRNRYRHTAKQRKEMLYESNGERLV